ncbi:MAG TPA: galactokinase [Candidatus Limnocylindrales bacterium]|nr:galactokinase [Candidatus Limnocylindrales bacterium]
MTQPFEPDALIAALRDRYPEAEDDRAAIRVIRSPGRVNLIGEHTDYNLGYVLPAAIDREIRIAAIATDDRLVDLTRLDAGERRSFDLDTDRRPDGSWLDYVAGVAWALTAAGHSTSGMRGVIATTLPSGAGLSSSAALELAAAWALLGDATGELDRLELARLCQRAENEYVGVQSGLMDQFSAACGVRGSALFLDCRSLDWRPVPLPDDVAVVVIDSGSRRRLGASAYNERRAQCDAAVAALRAVDTSIRSLRDVSPTFFDAHEDRLDPVVARRARHVVAENQRVLDGVEAFDAQDLGTVGRLFAESHASLRDLFEVSSPELDGLVGIATGVDGVIAARLTGAGFGGCTVNLVRPDAVERLRLAIERDYPARSGRAATMLAVTAATGAGLLER